MTHEWNCHPQDLDNVITLKVNERESCYVPKRILDLFRSRILLVTHGQNGVEVWENDKRYVIKGNPVTTSDTLGAGDTFFGSFVAEYLKLGNAKPAVEAAVTVAEQFLLERKKP